MAEDNGQEESLRKEQERQARLAAREEAKQQEQTQREVAKQQERTQAQEQRETAKQQERAETQAQREQERTSGSQANNAQADPQNDRLPGQQGNLPDQLDARDRQLDAESDRRSNRLDESESPDALGRLDPKTFDPHKFGGSGAPGLPAGSKDLPREPRGNDLSDSRDNSVLDAQDAAGKGRLDDDLKNRNRPQRPENTANKPLPDGSRPEDKAKNPDQARERQQNRNSDPSRRDPSKNDPAKKPAEGLPDQNNQKARKENPLGPAAAGSPNANQKVDPKSPEGEHAKAKQAMQDSTKALIAKETATSLGQKYTGDDEPQKSGKKPSPLDDRGGKDDDLSRVGPDDKSAGRGQFKNAAKTKDSSQNKAGKKKKPLGGGKDDDDDEDEEGQGGGKKRGRLGRRSKGGRAMLYGAVAAATAATGFVLIMIIAITLIAGQVATTGTTAATADSGVSCKDPQQEGPNRGGSSNALGLNIVTASSNDATLVGTSMASPHGNLTLDAQRVDNLEAIVSTVESSGIENPEQATLIALMTAWQESTMEILEGGDRDSEGLYQQRPSTGWGSSAELRDPEASTLAFLGLADHTNNPGLNDIDGWESMTLNDAAQAVQRSGHPDEYAKWEPISRSIQEDLTGTSWSGGGGSLSAPSTGNFDCGEDVQALLDSSGQCPAVGVETSNSDILGPDVLSDDALLALRCVTAAFPEYRNYSGYRAGDTFEHGDVPGNAIDFMLDHSAQPWGGDYSSSEGQQYGVDTAEWMVQNRTQLGTMYVIFDNKVWHESTDDPGTPWSEWRDYTDASGNLYANPTAAHEDHPHISVHGNAGVGFGGGANSNGTSVLAGDFDSDNWANPLGDASYTSTSGFGSRGAPCATCSSNHMGHDLAAPGGTPIYASMDGEVDAVFTESSPHANVGVYARIVHDSEQGIRTSYSHMTRLDVAVGDTVSAGDQVGTVGTTGSSTGDHLHFETHIGNQPVDPVPVMRDVGVDLIGEAS